MNLCCKLSYRISRKLLSLVLQSLVIVVLCISMGCGVIKKRPESEPSPFEMAKKPMTQEEAKQVLEEQGGDFIYGTGIGSSALNLSGIVLFPPYALYLLGNSLLTLSGYENVYFTDALPEESKQQWNDAYDGITGAPGRVAASLAGEEYRDRELIEDRNRVRSEKRAQLKELTDPDKLTEELWHKSDL